MSEPMVLESRQLSKTYEDGALRAEVLREVEFGVAPGDQIAIVGASGSGKSTLLHLLGGLDSPSSGSVLIEGQDIHALSDAARGQLRNRTLGFIYQFHHLLPEFTALENVAMPLLVRRQELNEVRTLAREILTRVGLEHRLLHKPGELSGGERQRTAVARALVAKPRCVLADEPTGNLDHRTADQVYGLMLEINRELGTSLVVVTHDGQLASKIGRVLTLEDGILKA